MQENAYGTIPMDASTDGRERIPSEMVSAIITSLC